MFNAYEDKLKNPENWLSRDDLRKFLELDTDKGKFNEYMLELESLDNSYEYMQGTKNTNITYNKVRIYNYINSQLLNKKREKAKKGA